MSKITIDWYKDGDYQHNLVNLLACLNGDAGQYQVKHGTKRAMEFALERFYAAIDADPTPPPTHPEGTWAWACDQMLAGKTLIMTSPDGKSTAKFSLQQGLMVSSQGDIFTFTDQLFNSRDWKVECDEATKPSA